MNHNGQGDVPMGNDAEHNLKAKQVMPRRLSKQSSRI